MHKLHGELDLYKYKIKSDGTWELVDSHHQTNYDTLRGRLDPNFSANCYMVTRLECAHRAKYPCPPEYDIISTLPIYFNEPLFVPDALTISNIGTNYYAISYDGGSNWWTHDGVDFQSAVFSTAADLRSVGMTDTAFEAMTSAIHAEKYIDSLIVVMTPSDMSSTAYGYDFVLKYDSSKIDPYYARWVGDLPVLSRYTLETLPISSAKDGNTYTINVSNISGVAPIELDTLLTYVDKYIGTFTYVGITVEVDEILVGSYTITELVEQDVDTARSKNAKYYFWGTETPSKDDGVLGGARFHGAETSSGIYTYTGGPAENVWSWPFIADRKFRKASLNRSIWMPYTSTLAFGDNIVDPTYLLDSTGGVSMSCTDKADYMSGLSFWPFYARFLFTSTGDAGDAEYLLYRAARPGSLASIPRIRSTEWVYVSSSTYAWLFNFFGSNSYHPFFHPLLRRPDRMVPWSSIMYSGLTYDGYVVPRCAYNSFHDVIVEVYDDHLDISRYAGRKLLTVNANEGEVFKTAHLTFEDPTGRDLTIWYYVTGTGEHYLASLPVTIVRDMSMLDFVVSVTGDLTERVFYSNISTPVGRPAAALALREAILTQDALGGAWGTAELLAELKTTDSLSFSTSLHQDIAGTVSDATKIFDQMWTYRNLVKNGSVPTSADLSGHQVATFTGSSFLYMVDGPGTSGMNVKWADQRSMTSTYLEFTPSSLQNGTVLQNLRTKFNLESGGSLSVSAPGLGASLAYSEGLQGRALTSTDSGYRDIRYGHSYIDPSDDTVKLVGLNGNGITVMGQTDTSIPARRTFDAVGIAGARWCYPYYDQATMSVKIVRVHYSSANLIISTYDIDNDTYSTSYTVLVDGAAFTHANSALTSIYTNDSGDPVLVIFSGAGWVQADGLIEVNLTTMTATKIALTGGYYAHIVFSSFDYGLFKGTTFKDSSGDWVTAAVRDPSTGEMAFINHTTGVYTSVSVGFIGTLPSPYYQYPYSISQIPGSTYALWILDDYTMTSSYGEVITISVIDLENMSLVRSGIEAVTFQSTSVTNPTYCGESTYARYPAGSAKYDIPTEWVDHCMLRSDASYNVLHLLSMKVHTVSIGGIDDHHSCSYTTDLTKLGSINYPAFSLTVVDDEIAVTGTPSPWLSHSPNSTSKRLSSLVIGGSLAYSGSGDVNTISNYTSSGLYSGTVKNFVTKTQPIRYGAYKFVGRLHSLDEIDHFTTSLTGTTTFLIQLVVNGEAATYFLDTNNSGTLTAITDLNRASVTPNTLAYINSALASIRSVMGTGVRMGLVYYDINGNAPADSARSLTYAVLDALLVDEPPAQYDWPAQNSVSVLACRNGNAYMFSYPCLNLQLHDGDILWTNTASTYDTRGCMSLMHTPNGSMGFFETLTSIASTPSGTMSFFGIGADDSVLFNSLSYDSWTTSRLPPRHMLCSDVFGDLTDVALWTRASSDLSEHESLAFFMPDDPTRTAMFLPMTNRTMDDASIKAGRFPLSWKDGVFSTCMPWPFDAPAKFTSTTNSSGSVSWGNLGWYFVDGATPSFYTDEILSFAIHNNYGYSIDNYQIVNTTSMLSKGDMFVGAGLGSVNIDGRTVNIDAQAVIVDKSSAMLGTSSSNDTIFTTIKKS